MENDIENVEIEEVETPEVAEQPTQQDIQAEKDRNWQKLREQQDASERRANEAERRALEMERKILEMQTPRPAPEVPEYPVADDDYVDHKTLKRYNSELEQRHANLENRLTEMLIKAELPDFDAIMSESNLKKLAKEYPDLAQTISASRADVQSQARATYTLIKKLGISDVETEQNLEKLQKNIKRPQATNAISKQESELTKAHLFESGRITKEEKNARWKLMKERAANV